MSVFFPSQYKGTLPKTTYCIRRQIFLPYHFSYTKKPTFEKSWSDWKICNRGIVQVFYSYSVKISSQIYFFIKLVHLQFFLFLEIYR
jgi:hypothetical protein